VEQILAQAIISGITTGAIYALVALGFCIVHNATRIVNFAQGDFLSLGGLVAYSVFVQAGLGWMVALPAALLAVAGVGALMELMCLRPARNQELTVLVFITIAASTLIRGISRHIWGKQALALPALGAQEPIRLFGAVFTPQNLWIVGMSLAGIAALEGFFRLTLTGKAMRAAAMAPRPAALVGISPGRMRTLAFALAGALGALGGVLITPITSLSYDVGLIIGLKGFAAAVLGGYGSVAGAIVGGVALGLVESLCAGLLSSVYKDAIAFVILLGVLFLRPGGIMGVNEEVRV